MWFGTFLSLLLGILAFAGENAIGAVFSLVITGQYVSYSIPMAARFLGGKTVQPGPFRLGRFVSHFMFTHRSKATDVTPVIPESTSCCDCRHLDDFHDCCVHVSPYALSRGRQYELHSCSTRSVPSNERFGALTQDLQVAFWCFPPSTFTFRNMAGCIGSKDRSQRSRHLRYRSSTVKMKKNDMPVDGVSTSAYIGRNGSLFVYNVTIDILILHFE